MADEKVTMKPKRSGKIAHGLYVRDVLLPWDDREEFDALHHDLKYEFFPSGPSEEECVLDLAQLFWQKRTIWRLRTATVSRDRFTEEIVATKKKSWAGIRQTLRKNAREEHTLLQTMEAAVADAMSNMARAVRKIAKDPSAEEVEKLAPLLNLGAELVRQSVMPLLEEVRQLPNAEEAFDKSHTPEALERIVRLETSIDVRIGKVMARIVALKEFKRTPAGSRLPQLTASRPLGITTD